MPIYVDVIAKLDERAAAAAAKRIEHQFGAAGQDAGEEFNSKLSQEISKNTAAINTLTDRIGQGMTQGFGRVGRRAGQSFGGSFTKELTSSIPVVSGFSSMLSGYEGAASKVGAAAGRALGLAFTTAAAGVIGFAGFALFKGFERYQAIDAAKNRLENLNRTLEATGRATIDVGRVMEVVNETVTGTPFALDKSFSIATRALSSNTGNLKRFMTVVSDAAGFAGQDIEEIGDAFLKVANTGKLSMEEVSNQLRNIPILPWLQEQFNVTGDELAKMISEGKVGLEDLLRAVETNASGFAKAAGNTIEGAISNMKTAVARTGANFLGALFGQPTEEGNELVGVVETLTQRINDLNVWITAHQDDIKRMFDQGVDAARSLISMIEKVLSFLDRIGVGVDDVVTAFVAWKTIAGVESLITRLGVVETALGTNLPRAAEKGAAGISAALSRIAIPLWLATLIEDKYPNFPFQDQPNGEDRIFPGWVPILPAWEENIRRFTGGGDDNVLTPGAAGPPSGPWNEAFSRHFLGTGPVDMFNPGSLGGGPGAQAERRGGAPAAGTGGAEPAGGDILPPPGASGDDKEKAGKLPTAPVVPFDPNLPPELAQLFAGLPMTSSIFGAQDSYLNARHKLAEKDARLRQLENSAEASAEDVLNARNERLQAERDLQQAEMKLYETAQNEFQKFSKQMKQTTSDLGEIGAKLDDDFGISRGLAGIAENLTKFIANLAAAPLLGQLGAISAADPHKGGYGLMGILGAQGAFGPQFTGLPDDYGAQAGVSGYGGYGAYPSAMGPAGLQFAANDRVSAAIALAQSANGGRYGWGASDLVKGLADCSGAVSDLVEVIQKGGATPGRLFNTEDFAAYAMQNGWQKGFMPGALNVGVKHGGRGGGHMAATLPNGVNFESGGAHGGIAYGGPAAGALDPQFTERWFLPVGGPMGPMTTPTSAPMTAPYSTSSGTLPTGMGAAPAGFGPTAPGMGGPQPATQIGSVVDAPQGIGQGGIGMSGGGTLDMAMSAAASGLDMLAPGAGQAAQTGMKLINRTIEYAGQVAGIGVQGLMETFLPTGGSELANNSWLTRIVGGLAGARPTLPNVAGKKQGAPLDQQQNPVDPNTTQHGTGRGQPPGPVSVTVNNNRATEDGTGRDVAFHLNAMYSAPGM